MMIYAMTKGSSVMLKPSRMMLVIIGISFSGAGFADDAKYSDANGETLPAVTLSLKALPAEWDYAPRWQPSHPIRTMAYSSDLSQPIPNFNFQDSGALASLSKLRGLSLLTFAEIGRARLFLGVNEDGVVGLHLRAFHRYGDKRYLEVVRMPYLKEDQSDTEAELSGPAEDLTSTSVLIHDSEATAARP